MKRNDVEHFVANCVLFIFCVCVIFPFHSHSHSYSRSHSVWVRSFVTPLRSMCESETINYICLMAFVVTRSVSMCKSCVCFAILNIHYSLSVSLFYCFLLHTPHCHWQFCAEESRHAAVIATTTTAAAATTAMQWMKREKLTAAQTMTRKLKKKYVSFLPKINSRLTNFRYKFQAN